MAITRPTPFIEGKAGDLITAARWNELQIQAREEIAGSVAKHESTWHAGDTQNLKLASLKADAVEATALTAGALTGGTVKATSLATGSLTGDTGTLGALSVKTLQVTDKLTLSGVSGALSPRVYAAQFVHGGVTSLFGSNLSVSNNSYASQYGPAFYTSGNLGYWAGVAPQMTLKLETAGLVQLHASWVTYNSSGNWIWGQFIVGSGGKYAPVRTEMAYSATYAGDWGVNGFTYSPPFRPWFPTAATWQTWLDYNWSFYNSNSYRWPLAGVSVHQSSHMAVSHQDCVELPAGTYTVQMGFSGTAYIANLQLRATFFPGGTAQSSGVTNQ